jgi:hypothetical protein
VAIVTGPDAYNDGSRLYLTVAILAGDQSRALPGGGA